MLHYIYKKSTQESTVSEISISIMFGIQPNPPHKRFPASFAPVVWDIGRKQILTRILIVLKTETCLCSYPMHECLGQVSSLDTKKPVLSFYFVFGMLLSQVTLVILCLVRFVFITNYFTSLSNT